MSAPEKKKSFMGEFKTFIARGNVMDMAVGVIIGGAFSTIVSSLVNDIHQQAEEACTCCCADHKGLSVLQVRDTY